MKVLVTCTVAPDMAPLTRRMMFCAGHVRSWRPARGLVRGEPLRTVSEGNGDACTPTAWGLRQLNVLMKGTAPMRGYPLHVLAVRSRHLVTSCELTL